MGFRVHRAARASGLVLITLVVGVGCFAAGSRPDPAVVTLRDSIPALLEAHTVPGLAVAIVREGRLEWTGGFGVGDAGAGDPVTEETVFEAASLSKPVFAYLVMRLVETGMLDLDTPVARYLPRPAPADARLLRVTPRQILSHTAGFPPWERDSELRLDTDPGSGWRYSGEGYVFLQRAVEELTGEPLQALARRLVFEPLGMSRSAFGWRDDLASNAAVPHDSAGSARAVSRMDARDVARSGAASTLYTTASDFGRFVAAAGGPGVASWTADMFEPHVSVDETLGLSWGLGWAIQRSGGRSVLAFHWGANPHFRSFAMVEPRTGDGWVALTNGPLGLELMDEIGSIITGTEHPLFSFYMMHPTD